MADDNGDRAWLVAHQRGVLSRTQALASGLSRETVRHRIRTGGPWQRLLPGIYLTATGQPTSEQMRIAAVLYGGPESAVTGRSALRNYGIRPEEARIVDLLVPASRSLAGSGFVSVHRTWRLPEYWICDGPVRFAPAERAVADTVDRKSTRLNSSHRP